MARASTSTQLTLGKVRANIALYKTVKERRSPKDFGLVKRGVEDPVTAGISGGSRSVGNDAPERGPVQRGLEVDGRFVDLTEQLADIDSRTSLDEMKVIAFIPIGHVPRERLAGSYWLASDGPSAPKVLKLLLKVMEDQRVAGVVKWTKRSRQALGVIAPGSRGALLVMELAFSDQVNEEPPSAIAHLGATVSANEFEVARNLVLRMTVDGSLINDLEDDRDRLYRELVEQTLIGEQFEVTEDEDEHAELIEELFQAVSGA